MTSKKHTRTRLVLLISLLIGSAWYSYCKLDKAREKYQASSVEQAETKKLENAPAEQQASPAEKAEPQKDDAASKEKDDVAKDADKNASAEILKQAEQFRGWSVLVLGGIVAILVTTKVHRIPNVEWPYLLLGPATVFMVNSLRAGWVLSKRYTYLVATANISDFESLSELLNVESDLFLYSLLCVSVFAGWFLFLIVLGKVEPFEIEKKN